MRCQCCGGRDYKVIAKLRNASIARCLNCNLTFVINDKSDFRSSNTDYFDAYDLEKYVAYYQDFRNRLYKTHLLNIEKFVSKGPILDIGCAFGWFLEVARDLGWQVFGIEQTERIAEIARKKNGLNVISGDLKSIGHFNTDFKVITLWNVLEHIAEPLNALRSLYDKLSPDGLLVISVPNINGLYSRLAYLSYKISLGRVTFPLEQLYQIDNPYMHMFHFSEHTLESLLKKCNFRVIRAFKQPVIDIRKIGERIDMEKNLKTGLLRPVLIGITKAVFYLSEVTNLHDEIVLYVKKC
jgi:2-polyprenyl-3-methyl-5-hydroxy-6-metoxy-1,4-benzoquinol methylase